MKTVKVVSTSNLTIKKSKFIGFCYRVDSEDDVKSILNDIQKKYNDAKHITYAYKIGDNISKKENSSEPAGTAGTPILCAIENKELTNTLVVVVRYFGGILLGSSNLYRAYSDTAINAINANEICELYRYKKYKVKISYIDYAVINSLANKTQFLKVLDVDFDTEITAEIAVCSEKLEKNIDKILESAEILGDLWL